MIDKIRLFFNKNKSKNDVFNFCETVLSVQGFGWSGSGAVSDLLREFKAIKIYKLCDLNYTVNDDFTVNSEITFYMYLYIELLEKSVINYNDDIDSHMAFDWCIKNVLNTMKYCFCVNCVDITRDLNEYITSLSIDNKLFINNIMLLDGDYVFYTKREDVDIDSFIYLTQKFFRAIFNKLAFNNKILLLDQFLQTSDDYGADIDKHKRFFGLDLKQICVYRDPRDQFCMLYSNQHFIMRSGDRVIKRTYNINNFIEDLSKRLICFTPPHPNRLVIRFEDLINDYENSIGTICDFLGIDKSHHINKGKYFIPEISRKNIGVYKNYHNQSVMQKIKRKLGEYCYE